MKTAQSNIKTVVGVLITMGVLVIFYASGWLRPIEHWLGIVVQPAFHVFYAVLDTVSPLYTTTDSTLLAENTALKDMLVQVVRKNHTLETQINQYKEYEEQLAFARTQEYTIIPARIISRTSLGDISQVVIINRGSNDELMVGYPVIYGAGVFLGLVTVIHDTSAEVTLLTHETSQVQAMIESHTATTGIIRGQFGTSLQFEYILKDQPISEGDVVISNGQDQFIPSGFVIGTVETVTESPSDLFKYAAVTPLIRYGNNAIVSVIVPTQ